MTRRVKLTTLSALAALLAPLMFASGAAHAEGLDYFKGKMTPFTKKPELFSAWAVLRRRRLRQGQDDLQHPAIERQSVHREYREGDGRRGQEDRPRLHGMGKSGQPHRICSGHEHGSQSEGHSYRSPGGAGSSRARPAGQGGRGCGNPHGRLPFQRLRTIRRSRQIRGGRRSHRLFHRGRAARRLGGRKDRGQAERAHRHRAGPALFGFDARRHEGGTRQMRGLQEQSGRVPGLPGPARSRPACRPRCSPIPRSTTSS